jgi:uncharacterized membrane protein YjgN (DUF898 family)
MNEQYPGISESHDRVEYQQQVEFRGEGKEYFKIWFVNILLSILTLGIYSAWAKVRRLKYFSNNTFLDGRSFSFEADPLSVLKGRLVMIIILAGFGALSYIAPIAEYVLWTFVFLGLMPMAVIASIKFRLKNTRYRGIRFNFTGKYTFAFVMYSLPYIALAILAFLAIQLLKDESLVLFSIVVVVGVMTMPMILFYQTAYLVNNAWYGDQAFEFKGDVKAFYKDTLAYFGLLSLAILMLCEVFGEAMVVAGIAMLALLVMSGWAYIDLKMRNLMINHLQLKDIKAQSTMTFGSYYWLNAKNAILTNFTFGIYRPFAMVNIAQYKAMATQVFLTDTLLEVIQETTRKRSAFGEEAADTLFDFGCVALK